MLLCHDASQGDKRMHRTMVWLPEEMHKNLKRLAVEREDSLAGLIREAVENQFREDLEDIQEARKQLIGHKPGAWPAYRSFSGSLRSSKR